jgi:hypothetical protein
LFEKHVFTDVWYSLLVKLTLKKLVDLEYNELIVHFVTGSRAGQYLTHRDVPDKEGKGSDLADITYSVLEEYDSADTVEAVLMDNTPVNTGFQGGLCACLEKKLDRKLHLIGCFLHINELPLRHLIQKLDGPTISGNKLAGPIGRVLDDEDLHKRNPVDFVPIPVGCVRKPEDDSLEELSDDQRLLMEYMFGVASGTIEKKYLHRKPGPLNLSRWLTTATRILMLYTRTEDPSPTLTALVTFIVQSYAPTWFLVRFHNNFVRGPAILFDMMKGVEKVQATIISSTQSTAGPSEGGYQEENITDIVKKVLKRNAFCCTGENFLASLLYSKKAEHRQVAVDKILKIRSGPKPKLIATRLPEVNFDVRNWSDMVDVSKLECQEPPCVSKLSSDELKAMVAAPGSPPNYPLHSQSVERAVKLTSEASKHSYIWRTRHNSIVAKNKSRAERPEFRTKSSYV